MSLPLILAESSNVDSVLAVDAFPPLVIAKVDRKERVVRRENMFFEVVCGNGNGQFDFIELRG